LGPRRAGPGVRATSSGSSPHDRKGGQDLGGIRIRRHCRLDEHRRFRRATAGDRSGR
jgi:hypothetical protein